MERSLDQAAGPIQLENHPANFVVLSGKASDLGVQLDALCPGGSKTAIFLANSARLAV